MEKISCFKSISLVKTAQQESGIYLIEGYANVYDVLDNHHDIIKADAFEGVETSKIKFLWQHMTDKPIGKIMRLYSDQKGLFIAARVDTKLAQGYEAARLVELGIIDGLSIGFEILEHHYENGVRIISKAKLWEVSIVTFPANPFSVIENSHLGEKKMLERSFEDRLHDVEKVLHRPNLDLTTMSDFSMKSFIRSGDTSMLNTKAALTSHDDSAGFAIPPVLHKQILGGMEIISPMRKLSSIETISSNVLELLIEDTKFGCGWVAEVADRTETNSAKILKKQIHVHELYAQPKATQRLLDDNEVNVENWLAEKLRDSFAKAENEAFILGDGVGKPVGILHKNEKIEKIVSSATKGGVDFDDVLHLMSALPDQYARNASFLMNRSTLIHIRSLRDANGRFIWQPSAIVGQPDTIFGIPVYSCEEMPIMKKDAMPIVLADFKVAYKIVDRKEMHMMRDPYTEKPFVKFYATKRVGGDVVNTKAIKILTL